MSTITKENNLSTNFQDHLEGLMPEKKIGCGLRTAEFCAGIGGFEHALRRLGTRNVFACEINAFARETWKLNNLFSDEFGVDLTRFPTTEIPDHDILCAGFPCQTFSIAGQKAGFADMRGTVIFDIARIISRKRPKAFILENVRHLVNHDFGRTLPKILTLLRGLKYDVQYQVLDAQDYGLPQHRERIFIVGIATDLGGLAGFEFPEPFELAYSLSQLTGEYCVREASRTITCGGGGGKLANGEKNVSFDVVERVGQQPRRLTQREALRLQGFPETFVPHPLKKHAKVQVGNAVPPPLVYAVAHPLIQVLQSALELNTRMAA